MARKSWREISAKNREDPARVDRVERGARAMLLLSALTRLRESLGLTQAELAAALGLSQARVSQIENQDDFTFSTLDQVVQGLGAELEINARFPDKTVALLGGAGGQANEHRVRGSNVFEERLTVVSPTVRVVHGQAQVHTIGMGMHLIRNKQADSLRIAAAVEQSLAKLRQQTPAYPRRTE